MKTDKSTRILLVVNEMDWFWSHRLPLANGILQKKWALTLATHEASSEKGLVDKGIEALDIPRLKRFYNLFSHVSLVVSLCKAFTSLKPDVVHVITLRYAFYVGLASRFVNYSPVIFTIAGLGSLFSSPSAKMRLCRFFAIPILKFAFGGRDRLFIFQNPDDRNILLALGVAKSEQAYLIRGSGVDLEDFPYVPYQETSGAPKILFASRLLRDKGISDFIAAAKILKDKGVDAEFVVAGDLIHGNNRFISPGEMQQAHAEGIVDWRGTVTNIQLLMQESMMIVFPSYYGEGVPKVLLEAAATGRPIITCDVPGCREIVQNDVNGILTPPRSPQWLAEAMESLIADVTKRHAQGKAGRHLVEEEFQSDLVVQQTMDVYEQALGLANEAVSNPG